MPLLNHYRKMLYNNIYKYIITYTIVACGPIYLSLIMDVLIVDHPELVYSNLLLIICGIILLVLFAVVFLSICASFNKKLAQDR